MTKLVDLHALGYTFLFYVPIFWIGAIFGPLEHPLRADSFLITWIATIFYLVIGLALIAGIIACLKDTLKSHKLTIRSFFATFMTALAIHALGLTLLVLLLAKKDG
ncbi:MAG: hypothetical protein Q8P25_02135 [Candidatus Curtissbacteria bacterium]|nr:hypothetical protein [Candidatus Curtissbacteria bacterium]